VPIRTFADWTEPLPGYMEMDLVAHCGGSMTGSYAHTLSLTDVATWWTEPSGPTSGTTISLTFALRSGENDQQRNARYLPCLARLPPLAGFFFALSQRATPGKICSRAGQDGFQKRHSLGATRSGGRQSTRIPFRWAKTHAGVMYEEISRFAVAVAVSVGKQRARGAGGTGGGGQRDMRTCTSKLAQKFLKSFALCEA